MKLRNLLESVPRGGETNHLALARRQLTYRLQKLRELRAAFRLRSESIDCHVLQRQALVADKRRLERKRLSARLSVRPRDGAPHLVDDCAADPGVREADERHAEVGVVAINSFDQANRPG